MSNIVEPIRNKNGEIKTNVEVCKELYGVLKTMRDGNPVLSEKENERNQDQFYKICNDSRTANEVMEWLKQINDEEDYDKAQKLIARTLLPVPGISNQMPQPNQLKSKKRR